MVHHTHKKKPKGHKSKDWPTVFRKGRQQGEEGCLWSMVWSFIAKKQKIWWGGKANDLLTVFKKGRQRQRRGKREREEGCQEAIDFW